MKSLNEFLNEITSIEQLFYDDKTKVLKSQMAKGLHFIKTGDWKEPIKLEYKGKEIGEVTYDRDKDHHIVELTDSKMEKTLDHAGLRAQGWPGKPYRYDTAGNMMAAVAYAVLGKKPTVYNVDGRFSDYE